jgi:hypothetical protein
MGLVAVGCGLAVIRAVSATEAPDARDSKLAQAQTSVLAKREQTTPKKQPSAAPQSATQTTTPAGQSPAWEDLPPEERAAATARAQRCLAELGYYKGVIDGKRGEETWTAYWNFKHDNGLKSYNDFLAGPVQDKLFSLCKNSEQTAGVEPSSAAQPETPAEPAEIEAGPPSDGPFLDIDCLPDDLLAQLRRAHGIGVTATSCDTTCLPAPRGLNQAQLDDLSAQNGLSWCTNCIPFKGHLVLDDVRRIEHAGNIALCPQPPLQLPRDGNGVVFGLRAYTKIRELYRALPPVPEPGAAIAVVIGNRNYAKLPPSETALNDAGAMYSFLTEHLGYRQDNVIDIRDAKKADLDRVFGAGGDLARLFRSNPNAKIVVYFSGLGATDGDQKESYLLPIDAEPYREDRTGYALSKLYANLAKLNAKSVLVLLEAEYGRDHSSYVLPPNLPDSMISALPPAPVPGITVLSASDRGQRTLIDSTYDVGLFTRYLIEGLAGNADLAPIGNGDGIIDSAEIYVYTAAMVELAARKTFGLLQNPVYSSAATAVLSNAGTVAAR